MASKTYPVGSVVKVKEQNLLVIGTRMMEENNKLVKSYLAVSYPVGYLGWDHVCVVPASEASLVSEGYRSPAAEPYLTYLDGMDIASEYADAKTIQNALEEASKKILGGN